MSKKLISILLLVVGVGGAGVGLFVYRNITRQPTSVVEQTEVNPTTVSGSVEKSGQFQGADAVHKGIGTASIVKIDQGTVLKFENFSVTNGPDLFVYLSPNSAGGELGEFASLGELKSASGNQVYNLPDDYSQYKSVVIWCRAFGVEFAAANLR